MTTQENVPTTNGESHSTKLKKCSMYAAFIAMAGGATGAYAVIESSLQNESIPTDVTIAGIGTFIVAIGASIHASYRDNQNAINSGNIRTDS